MSEAISASNEKNFAIPVEELEAWESRHGIIPDGVVVLLRTGWGSKSQDLMEYSGLDNNGIFNFPGKWLVASHAIFPFLILCN